MRITATLSLVRCLTFSITFDYGLNIQFQFHPIQSIPFYILHLEFQLVLCSIPFLFGLYQIHFPFKFHFVIYNVRISFMENYMYDIFIYILLRYRCRHRENENMAYELLCVVLCPIYAFLSLFSSLAHFLSPSPSPPLPFSLWFCHSVVC